MDAFFCTEGFYRHEDVASHPKNRWRRYGSTYQSGGAEVDEGYERSRTHLWDSTYDFTSATANNHYDAYHNPHYGRSGNHTFDRRSGNERLSYPVSSWAPGPSSQGGIHDNGRIDWVGDSETPVNQTWEVMNDDNMLYNAVFIGDHVLRFDQAGMLAREVGHEEFSEEGILSPETDQSAEHNNPWYNEPAFSEEHSSTTTDFGLDNYYNKYFLHDLSGGLNASHSPHSIDFSAFNIASPISTLNTSSDGSSAYHDPSDFYSTSPRPSSGSFQYGNHIKRQWQILNIAASSLRRQQRRIRHSLRVLHRAQRGFEIERQELRNLQDNRMRDSERKHRCCPKDEDLSTDASNDACSRDFWKPRRRETGKPWEEDLLFTASKSAEEPHQFRGHNHRHYSEQHHSDTHYGLNILPPLPADAVNQAANDLASYNSAWTSVLERSQNISPKIPYPTVTTQAGPLLEPFPSYVRLPSLPAFHPSSHVRIQFHTLEFYLHPLGLQASLTFNPPTESLDDFEQVLDTVLGVDRIDKLDFGSLIRFNVTIKAEKKKWHEDSLRRKGFGIVLDCEAVIGQDLDSAPEQNQHANNPERTLGNAYDLDEKFTGRDIVQGVWAAVQLLSELITSEIERRRT
ncbi:hypothetical protein MMC11_007292 [Xylographa trunciseda]|nr:hypothetical protein [Xylographa trunciseda]